MEDYCFSLLLPVISKTSRTWFRRGNEGKAITIMLK